VDRQRLFENAEASAAAVEPEWLVPHGRRREHRSRRVHADQRSSEGRSSSRAASGSARSTSKSRTMAHEAVAEAAAIAIAHPRWGERPLLIVTPRPEYRRGGGRKRAALIAFLGERFPRCDAARRRACRRRIAAYRDRQGHEDRLRELYGSHTLPKSVRMPMSAVAANSARRRARRGVFADALASASRSCRRRWPAPARPALPPRSQCRRMGGLGALLTAPDDIASWAQQFRGAKQRYLPDQSVVPDPPPRRDGEHEGRVREFLGQWGPLVPPEAGDADAP